MTTTNLQFTINQSVGASQRIFVGWLHAPLTSDTLPSNINYVKFDKGVGTIVYNDRPAIPETFTDPSPYQPYLEEWMTTFSTAVLPLTLAQAQELKVSLATAIYAAKSQAPISVVTSLGTFSFDMTPNGPISVLNAGLSLSAVAELAAQCNAINNAVVNMLSTINNAMHSYNASDNASFESIVSQLNTDFANMANDFNNLASELGQPLSLDTESVSFDAIGDNSGSYAAPANLSVPAASVKILPIGSTSYPAFTVNDLFAVLNAAQTQITTEALVFATKQAAINALGTVAAVIAYDVTTGW